MDFIIIIYIVLGLLPSLTWLSYYLTKDLHPEPKKMILKIFLWGALITVPVYFVQLGLQSLLAMTNFDPLTTGILYWFFIIALSEELFKYFVVKLKVIDSPHLDEPIDLMIYMVISALGFAAVENILYLFSPVGQLSFNQIIDRSLIVILVRFIGATFLHTLCSSVIGYSMVISVSKAERKFMPLIFGISLAILLHGLYDFSLMQFDGSIKIGIPIAIIVTLGISTFIIFEKVKKMKSVCKI